MHRSSVAATTDPLEELAILGGPQAVTQAQPAWPCVSDDEIGAVGDNLIENPTDCSYLTAVGKGGPCATKHVLTK